MMDWLSRFTKKEAVPLIAKPVFKPTNRLEALLMRATSDSGVRPEFYRAFLESEILIIGKSSNHKTGRFIADANTTLQFREIDFEGRRLIPMFTSLPRLREYLPREEPYLQINCHEFLTRVGSGKGLILNPASAYGKEFIPSEVAALINNSLFTPLEIHQVIQKEDVLVGTPGEYPAGLMNGLRSLFRTTPEVKQAYIVQIHKPASGEPAHLLVAIEADGDFAALAADCGVVIKEILERDKFADIIQLQGSGVENYLREECQPFYKKD